VKKVFDKKPQARYNTHHYEYELHFTDFAAIATPALTKHGTGRIVLR